MQVTRRDIAVAVIAGAVSLSAAALAQGTQEVLGPMVWDWEKLEAKNKKLAYEFINFRLEPEVQRAFHLAYRTSPGRPDITDWPDDYVATQLTTEAKMAAVDFPDSALIGSKRGEWTRKWQEIMSG